MVGFPLHVSACLVLAAIPVAGCTSPGIEVDSAADTTSGGEGSESQGTGGAETGTVPGTTSTAGVCEDDSGGFDLTAYSSTGGGAEETDAGMGNDIPIGLTVYEVRDASVDVGVLVEIADLVVISPVVADGFEWIVFAQGIDGGEFSGITVKLPTSVAGLEVGARVRLVGRTALRLGYVQIVVENVDNVTIEGTAAVPPPISLPIDDLLDPAADPAPYESVLVRIETPMVIVPDVCPGEFALASDLWVDDLFLGADAPTPAVGSTYAAIIGPLRAGASGYEVAPRSLDDLVP